MKLQTILRHIAGYCVGFSIFVVGIPSGLYLASIELDRYLPINLIPIDKLRVGISLLIGIIGIVFAVWSNLYLLFVGKGGPADGFGVTISPRMQHLVTSGPYRYTRHPMAFGALSGYLALALFLNSPICLAIVTGFLAAMAIYLKLVEEKRLLVDFGDSYQRYRNTVSMLVPFPSKKKK